MDIVKASGHNVLTAAVGVVAVLTLLIGKRVGSWGRGGLIATAVAVTFLAVAITHLRIGSLPAAVQAKLRTDRAAPLQRAPRRRR